MDITKLLPETNPWAARIEYNDFIESHLTDLLANWVGDRIEIESHIGEVFTGDFYGLLMSQRLSADIHYVTMRMNGLISSADYKGEAILLIVPKLDRIISLTNIFRTVYK